MNKHFIISTSSPSIIDILSVFCRLRTNNLLKGFTMLKIRIFKKLHPKFGELVTPKEILTSLITKYMDFDDTDKMFYVK